MITFSKKRSLWQKYYLNGIESDRIDHIKDSGIHFDSSLSFNKQYARMLNKASSTFKLYKSELQRF